MHTFIKFDDRIEIGHYVTYVNNDGVPITEFQPQLICRRKQFDEARKWHLAALAGVAYLNGSGRDLYYPYYEFV
jgi:hypothetical protein